LDHPVFADSSVSDFTVITTDTHTITSDVMYSLSTCVVLPFSAWFDDNCDNVLVRQISRRVSDVTGLNTTQPTAEPLQVSSQVVRLP